MTDDRDHDVHGMVADIPEEYDSAEEFVGAAIRLYRWLDDPEATLRRARAGGEGE
ncbi:hypothetical protein [Halomarina rubra]|uniref:Uncharacterized protein n=1 Tax=Halomarina rubra TaxID=2071873 RepID=A0ABD6AT32_9EURY|nr:hypothetical protein [Halomarina rubra]